MRNYPRSVINVDSLDTGMTNVGMGYTMKQSSNGASLSKPQMAVVVVEGEVLVMHQILTILIIYVVSRMMIP
jgi:hypothetical protein